MQLQKIISLLLFTIPYKAISYWKGQKLKFQKKIISVSGNHNISQKMTKNKQGIVLHNYF